MYHEELTECDMRKALVSSIPSTSIKSGLHEILHLTTESTLRTCIDHKLSGMGLI